MTILLNGQSIEVSPDDSFTLADLLVARGIKADRVAVERNGEIVARAVWAVTELCSGDKLEVVHFVGGG